jgi:DNA repair ATPase RecN
VSSESVTSPRPLTRAEQEVQSASERLNEQIDEALAAVASLRDPDSVEELDARAARLERAARDLSVALRELAEERRHRQADE